MGNTEQTHLYGSQENCLRAAINRLDMQVDTLDEAYRAARDEIYKSGYAAGRAYVRDGGDFGAAIGMAAMLEAEQAGEESLPSYTPYKNMPSAGPSNYKPYKYECSQAQSDAIEDLTKNNAVDAEDYIAHFVDEGLAKEKAADFRGVVTIQSRNWMVVDGVVPSDPSQQTHIGFTADLLTPALRQAISDARDGTFRLKILIMEDAPQLRSAFDAEGVVKNIANFTAELAEERYPGGARLGEFDIKLRMEEFARSLVRPLTDRIAELEAKVRK